MVQFCYFFVSDDDEVLTYEEVGLLQPSRNRKRPVVLIGKLFSRAVVSNSHMRISTFNECERVG